MSQESEKSISSPSQRRLSSRAPIQRSAQTRRKIALLLAARQQVTALLPHPLLLLHGDDALLLGPAQRPGDADEQRRHADGPQGAAREEHGRLGEAACGLEFVPEPAARRGRDDVAQRKDALGERLGGWVVVGFGGYFRVCR